MEFSEIMLTKEEMTALKELLERSVVIDSQNKSVYERLEHYGFVIFHASRSDNLALSASITTKGRDYLAFRAGMRRTRRSSFFYNLLLMASGSAITLLIEHSVEIFHWIKGLF